MTENEAIEVLNNFDMQVSAKADGAYQSTIGEMACGIAVKALSEIQQYRAIGTVEECREARERQIPKKIVIKNTKNKKLEEGIYVFYKCPECEEQIASGFYYPPHNEFLQEHKFCENCGQAIDWSE